MIPESIAAATVALDFYNFIRNGQLALSKTRIAQTIRE